MQLEKIVIEFNSEEFVQFLIDTTENSVKEVVRVIEDFKDTEMYLNDEYDERDIFNLLSESGIYCINLTTITEHSLYLYQHSNY